MADIAARSAFVPRVPLRALVVLALLIALAVAAIAYVGSQQRRLAPPFGPAKNGLVVYSQGGDLYTADLDTGQTRALTSGPAVDRKPMVSRDGSQVAFLRAPDASAPDGSFDLVVVPIAGGREVVVSTDKVGDGDPIVWSPDSTYLLRTDGGMNLFRHDVKGGAPRLVAKDAQVWGDGFRPPAGNQLLYEVMSGPRAFGVMNADGTDAHVIYTIPAAQTADGCDFNTLRWSPDGTRIAFTRRPVGAAEQCRLFVVNADGSNAREVATAPGTWVFADARWSPDGSELAFNRWRKTETDTWNINPIGLVPATGGEVRSVGPTPVSDGAAMDWSPDGTSIMFVPGSIVGWPPPYEAEATIIDVATGTSRQADWKAASWPSWQRLAP